MTVAGNIELGWPLSMHSDDNKEESVMPVLLVPLLVGVPVVLVGGYYIIHAMH